MSSKGERGTTDVTAILWRTTEDIKLTTPVAGERHDTSVLAPREDGFALAYVERTTSASLALGAYDASGRAQNAALRLPGDASALDGPSLTRLAGGELVADWAGLGGGALVTANGIARTYDGGGAAVLAPFAWGGFTRVAAGLDGVSSRLHDATGAALGPVSILAEGATLAPRATALSDGRVLVAWIAGSTGAARARVLDGDGDIVGAPINLASGVRDLAVVAFEGGGWLAAWTAPGAGGRDLYARAFAADGTPVGAVAAIAATAADERDPVLALAVDGSVLLAWTGADAEGAGVRLRRLDSRGLAISDEIALNAETRGDQTRPSLAVLADGRIAATWSDAGAIEGQVLALTTPIVGGAGADTLAGGNGPDLLLGEVGDDVLTGGDGPDQLAGGPGDDRLEGGAGSDTLVGGTGLDTVVYRLADLPPTPFDGSPVGTAIDVRLRLSDDESDRLLEVERLDVIGTAGDDRVRGGAGGDRLDGGAGADEIDGGPGADTLVGGLGDDRLIVDETGDVVVELAGEGFDVVESAIDLVIPEHVEMLTLIGSARVATGDARGNVLVGNALANVLDGGDGDDRLDGGPGADRLSGGLGADRLFGGDGDDLLDGGAGADLLDGGAGFDTATWSGFDRAVTIDLNAGRAWDGQALKTLVGIEAIIATAGNDSVFGSEIANDWIDGGAGGADTLYGGVGIDTLSYMSATRGVTIDFAAGASWDGFDHDRFRLFEHGVGSRFDDGLFGTGRETFDGGEGGADLFLFAATIAYDRSLRAVTIDATIGQSWDGVSLDRWTGSSAFRGSPGNDTFFGSGTQTFDGGAGGADRFVFPGRVIYDGSARAVTIDLAAGLSWDGVSHDSSTRLRNVRGSPFADTVFGSAEADVIDGGAGADQLLGGGGHDVFVLRRGEAAGDLIRDFEGYGAGPGDRVQLFGFAPGSTFRPAAGEPGLWFATDAATGIIEAVRVVGDLSPADILFG